MCFLIRYDVFILITMFTRVLYLVLISYHVLSNSLWCDNVSHKICKGIEFGNSFLPCAYQRSQKSPKSHNVHTCLKLSLIMIYGVGFLDTPKNLVHWVHVTHKTQLCLTKE